MDDHGARPGAISIVGVACQFPGASDPAELHDLVVAGRQMFRPVSPGAGGSLHAALIDGWTPGGTVADAAALPDSGPLRKLVTETVALARADAGLRDESGGSPGRNRIFLTGIEGAAGPGGRPEGDSLVAVAAACDALDAGDVDVAVAGGVQLGLDPRWLAERAAAGELGTSQMRVYDAEPAGMLPGDGCGVVVLMRSADARAAGLAVYAELAGWSVIGPGGSRDLLDVYVRAAVSPGDIALIEGRGTGTAAGDTAELTSLAQLRAEARGAAALGAISASIGYARAAAGAASLIKTITALVTGTIPPSTGSRRPHPMIESGSARVRLPPTPEPWPDGIRLAAVSSVQPARVGAHLILRREPDGTARPGRRRRTAQEVQPPHDPAPVNPAPSHPARCDPPRGDPSPAAPVSSGRIVDAVPMARSAAADAFRVPEAATVSASRAPQARGAAPDALRAPGDHRAADARPTTRDVLAPSLPLAAEVPAARPAADTVLPSTGTHGPATGTHGPAGRRPSAVARPGPAHVFAFCGADASMLASRLDVIADSAAELAGTDLADLAKHLAADAQRAAERGAPLRVTVTATAPGQLAQRARRAASMLRADAAGPRADDVAQRPLGGQPGASMAAEDGICVSAGVRGRVAVVFPRLAITSGDHAAMLASSLGSLRMLRQLGVTAYAAVGYSAGEIAGLVWAGCLSSAEAARLAALRGQVLNGCTQRQAAMVRVLGDSAVARKMCKQNGLHFAAYETDRSHVLAGSAADVRNLALHAAVIGIETEVLAATCALHTPAVARCAAPMRSVLSGIPFSPPRRPLISTVTGRLVTGDDDLGGLLTEQLSKPVLFTQAMAAAAEHADLIVVAGADDRLAANAAQAGARPAVTLAAHSVPVPDTVAALFAAGAIPLAVVSRSAWHLHDHRGKGPS